MTAEHHSSADHPSVELAAPSAEFPRCHFTLDRDLSAGSLIRVRAGGTQLLLGVAVDEVRISGAAQPLPFVHQFSRAEMERRWRWYITSMTMAVVRIEDDLRAGTALEVTASYGEHKMRGERASGRPSPQQSRDRYSGLSWWMHAVLIADADAEHGEAVAPPFEIRFVAGNAATVQAYLRHDGQLRVQHFDAVGNPTGAGNAASAATRLSITGGATDQLVEAAPGAAATAVALEPLSPPSRIEVQDADGRSATSNAPPVALDGTPIFFGEFHWHTEHSRDGQRPMRDALRSARDELCLDFAGPADHMSPSGDYGERTVREQAAVCRPFDEPGRFCAAPAAELSRRYGHANIYTDSWDLFEELTGRFANELASAWEQQPDRYDLRSLVNLCPPGRALVVPHHTNMDSFVREGVVRDDGRPFWCAMHWPLPADRQVIRLVEMVQTRGCFEAEQTDERWRIWDGGLGGSVRTALARGYRLGFVGGTDNHSGWPTRKGSGFCGLTAIQASELRWEALFGALHARRCYATTGARIVADVTLNGAPLGSELPLEPGAERRLRIRIHGTAALETVQVVHGGYVLADLPLPRDSADLDVEWADERPGRPLEDVYYYVRARQVDGECLWTSPIWVDLPD